MPVRLVYPPPAVSGFPFSLRSRTLWFAVVLVAGAVLAVAAPEAAVVFAPALAVFGLLLRGVRPGERLITRLARRRTPRLRPVMRARRPRIALVVRPVGRLLAAALAMRPPPVAPVLQL